MSHRKLLVVLSSVFGILTLLACGGGGGGGMGPVSTGASSVRLTAADVQVGGTSVCGTTISPGTGSSTLFTVMLHDAADRDHMGTVQMDYPAHSSMGMMGRTDSVACHDDGLDGDAMAGDGIYSYMDSSADGHVGVHSADCPAGTYMYAFHGTDSSGRDTNTVTCSVTVR